MYIFGNITKLFPFPWSISSRKPVHLPIFFTSGTVFCKNFENSMVSGSMSIPSGICYKDKHDMSIGELL